MKTLGVLLVLPLAIVLFLGYIAIPIYRAVRGDWELLAVLWLAAGLVFMAAVGFEILGRQGRQHD